MAFNNFFNPDFYREPEKTDSLLGICDPGGEDCAFTTNDVSCTDKWCATIHNPKKRTLRFVAIDKNMNIRKANGDLESTCDGMIYMKSERDVFFVELKDYHTGGALSEALKQLRNTILIFLSLHRYDSYHDRRAYICNPVRPHFASSYRQLSSEFRQKYHFRLYPQADIVID